MSCACILQVKDRDWLKPDDHLGKVELPVKDLMAWVAEDGSRAKQDGWWQLGGVSKGLINMQLQFKGYSSSSSSSGGGEGGGGD